MHTSSVCPQSVVDVVAGSNVLTAFVIAGIEASQPLVTTVHFELYKPADCAFSVPNYKEAYLGIATHQC